MVTLAEATFGPRGGKQTGAIAYARIGGRECLFLAQQGREISPEMLGRLTKAFRAIGIDDRRFRVLDAREYAVSMTALRKGQWTSYHAEMLIVAGMMGLTTSGLDRRSALMAKELYLKSLCSGKTIGANAPCCAHCAAMLTYLGFAYAQKSHLPGNTGWWNPLIDKATGHNAEGWGAYIPGLDVQPPPGASGGGGGGGGGPAVATAP